MKRGVLVYFFCMLTLVSLFAYVWGEPQQYDESDGIPPATSLQIYSNLSNYYDTDGYVTLNWTGATNASVGIANYTIWISTDTTTYRMNGSNTSATGYDFYGVSANYTFKIQSVNSSNGDAVSGQNLTWARGGYWFVVDKTAPSALNIKENTSAYYDTDGYITINWTTAGGPANESNYTVWISTDKGTTYTQNGSNTSSTGFDFYGVEANYTFRIHSVINDSGTIVNGNNYTWANGSYWFVIDKSLPSGFTLQSNATLHYDEGYLTGNWTAPSKTAAIINYTIWISTDKGTTYTQNGSNTSATGFDFYLIEANYTARLYWTGGEEGSLFNSANITWANGSYWFQIDKTAPTITSFSCTDAIVGQTVTCSCTATDALSGVASTSYTTNPDSSSVGTQSTTCTPTDNVGNSVSTTTTYSITAAGGEEPPPKAPSVSKSWDKIEPEAPVTMNIDKEGIDFTEIEIEVVNEASNPSIKIEKLVEEPTCEGQNLGNEYDKYQYIEITTSNLLENNLKTVTANFKVNQSWATENNINKDTVSVYRCADGQWREMVTELLNEDNNYAYYESILPGFSSFIIAGIEAGQIICDNDGTCEPAQGETTENCPDDCPAGTICTPDALQCFDDVLKQCNADGMAWVTVEVCQYGCSEGQCNEAPEAADYIWYIVGLVLVIIVILFLMAPSIKKFIRKAK